MKVAIIPARGGSKRIPRKNVRPFAGKPIIAYSIEAAKTSGCFERVIVSTDDAEIADVARAHGAEVPFVRPPELSHDHAGTVPVVQHALRWLQDAGAPADHACCLYATAPFVTADALQSGCRLLLDSDCSYVFTVTSFAFPVQRAIRIGESGRVEAMWPEAIFQRSQDLPEAFHDAGQFYWGRADAFLRGDVIFSKVSLPLILPRHRVQDIDTPEDWRRAELMFRALAAEAPGDGA